MKPKGFIRRQKFCSGKNSIDYFLIYYIFWFEKVLNNPNERSVIMSETPGVPSDVPSFKDGLLANDPFKFVQEVDSLNVDVYELTRDMTCEQIFGTDKTRLKGILIPRTKIDKICEVLVKESNNQNWFLFLYNYHGRYKILQARRTPTSDLEVVTDKLSNKSWLLVSQGYALVVPKLA